MATPSSSHQQNAEQHAFSLSGPPTKMRRLCESSKPYDVFINHRGPDVKQTVARDLYNFLHEKGLSVFLDSEELELGDVFPSRIETAIRSSLVHIAIFSKGYADSAWCLEELALMSETGAKIIPVFYDVEPTELRYIQNDYALAFAKYEEKRRYLDKLERWKESLRSASEITGYEFSKHNNDHKHLCENIGKAVLKEVQNTIPLHVAEHPVALNEVVKSLESYYLQKERKGETINIIGIFGMGGVGKTTLAKEFFNNKKSQYSASCFLYDVREADSKSELPSKQFKLLKDLFYANDVKFQSIDEGISHLKHRLGRAGRSRFLVVLDDIDNIAQIDALIVRDLVSNKRNQVIVTTRDEGVLINAGITFRYNLKGMNEVNGKELFCWHAFRQRSPRPASGYELLVDAFVEVCGGLPLSLKVFGGLVYGREHKYWSFQLDKIRNVLDKDVKRSLKVSFDSLDEEEKQIFMDIACFFIGERKKVAIKIWKASGIWNAELALQRLKEKCLLEEKEYIDWELRMHDHLRDLGRAMAEEMSPRRIWRLKDLQSLEIKGFQKIFAENNGRCFHSMLDSSIGAKITYFLGNSNDCAQTSSSLLLLELQFTGDDEHPSIPSWIPLQNLLYLKIRGGSLKRLWPNNVQVLSQLKELVVYSKLEEIPDLSGLVNQLECVYINGEKIQFQGWWLLKSPKIQFQGWWLLKSPKPRSFVLNSKSTIMRAVQSSSNLELKEMSSMYMSSYFPNLLLFNNLGTLAWNNGGQSTIDLGNIVDLNISKCHELEELCFEGLNCVETIRFDRCNKLICLEFIGCKKLKSVLRIEHLHSLVMLNIRDCPELQELSCLQRLSSLERITIDGCGKLNRLILMDCKILKTVSGKFDVTELLIYRCGELEELRNLAQVSRLERIEILRCKKLQNIIEELQGLKTLILGLDSNPNQWLQRLSKLPSECMSVSGRAGDGAHSTLNSPSFSSLIGNHAVRKIHTGEHGIRKVVVSVHDVGESDCLSAIIVCAHVVVPQTDGDWLWLRNGFRDCLSLRNGFGDCLSPRNGFKDSRLYHLEERGEWIVSMVMTDKKQIKRSIKYKQLITISKLSARPGIKNVCVVTVKKGQEWEALHVVKAIVNHLYK